MGSVGISEIFYSIQGETSMVGRPAVFVRTAGCNLKCSWCDTKYARRAGKERRLNDIISEIREYNCRTVVITGGEPLYQKNIIRLIDLLIKEGFSVILETNGSYDISGMPAPVKVILDMKTPSSSQALKMNFSNLKRLRKKDELKFVVAGKGDFEWSCRIIDRYRPSAGEILFSPVRGRISFDRLSRMVMENIPAGRIQANLHKCFRLK